MEVRCLQRRQWIAGCANHTGDKLRFQRLCNCDLLNRYVRLILWICLLDDLDDLTIKFPFLLILAGILQEVRVAESGHIRHRLQYPE